MKQYPQSIGRCICRVNADYVMMMSVLFEGSNDVQLIPECFLQFCLVSFLENYWNKVPFGSMTTIDNRVGGGTGQGGCNVLY
jgi:hypothetical protein